MAAFVANMQGVEESCHAFATEANRPSTANMANLEGEKRETRKFFLKKKLLVNEI